MGKDGLKDDGGSGRAGVERLLAELSDLRLLLDSDLTIAAAAVDAGSPQMAADMLSDEHERLNALQARILRPAEPVEQPGLEARIARLERPVIAAARAERRRRRVFAAATPALTAAAVAAAVLGGSVLTRPGSPRPTLAAQAERAEDHLAQLTEISSSAASDADEVTAAAAALHLSLAPLIAAAGSDPLSAQTALDLLTAEQNILLKTQPEGMTAILRETQLLIVRLRKAAPAVVPPAAAKPLPPVSSPTPAKSKASAKPSASPSPTKSPSPTPSATPKSSPSPSGTPSGSPSGSPSPEPTILPGL